MNHLASDGSYSKLIEKTSNEVFFVLFPNRELLLDFNQMLADIFEEEDKSSCPINLKAFLTDKGKAKRVNIAVWVKKAVFFRDRGRCVLCNKDLTGLWNLDNRPNYDHIVPLDKFGFNDITNIQLLCFSCNNNKRAKKGVTSSKIQPWY
ncbi:HNH endonuclease signature motif containing protein [Colwellia sp. Arc7-D]|uniref:HNH endonuclease n=1 Tax=Colwellia sp. Arc7-D TaxID=2161872 RepID=UPI000D34394C|nr:HNH endonuclease signature motif containing protein [Colwellia sp. Arc7-D]AWB56224.1 hypothetical protein DBO93_00670 [Colwellia sp. Arc7-D]